MGMENLDNFYFNSGGTYKKLLDECGVSDINDPETFPLCEFFADYNNAHDKKIINTRDAGNTGAYDLAFAASSFGLWSSSKTKKGGVGYAPIKKYELSILEKMYIKTNQAPTEYVTSQKAIDNGAGLLLLVGGGGSGGGADGGGWLDEPSGGGGGGSGAWALVYYRFKSINGGTPFYINFSGGAVEGGGAESWGSTGNTTYLTYNNQTLIQCLGGGGGQGDNTSDNTSGGSAGTWNISPGPGGDDVDGVLVNDSNLFMLVIIGGNGKTGQGSGQSGAGGRANDYSTTISAIPSTLKNQSLTFSYVGGNGGKADNSDPGGGGGAASIAGDGGHGAGSSSLAGNGGYGAGGGGGSEQQTHGGWGGAPVCLRYERL